MALLLNEKVIALQPSLIRALDGDLHGAIVLQQIAYWMPLAESEYDGHIWVWKTYPQMSEETALSVDQCRKATRRLEEAGLLISCQPEKETRTKWYRIDFEHPILISDHAANRPHDAANRPVACGESAASTSTTESTAEINDSSSAALGGDAVEDEDEPFAPLEENPDARALCEKLADHLEERSGGDARPNVTKGWVKDMDLLLRRGPLGWKTTPPSPEKVAKLIDWIFQHEGSNGFSWGDNIRSPKKLREQYMRLRDEANKSVKHSGKRTTHDQTLDAIDRVFGNQEEA